MTSSHIARQDSTLLSLIVQATARGASADVVEKYIKLLTLTSSKVRAQQIVEQARHEAGTLVAASA
ncbi:MAG: hypothetical protein JNN30_05535 [Rhodanobacteraceae bacterium]|nr:hypothetical protein [Rhodanobacteraceae bacterium]